MRPLSSTEQEEIVGGSGFAWRDFAGGLACGLAIGLAAGTGGLGIAAAAFACIAVMPS